MIRVKCPSCGSNLNAKDELAGQTRKCPKCAQPVFISADAAPSPSIATPPVATPPGPASPPVDTEASLPPVKLPERLNREYHYLICDRTHLVASWENNGQGWMLRTTVGAIPAKRNRDKIPVEGNFKLIELKLVHTDEGRRLIGMTIQQLARRWALTTLDQGDDQILEKVSGPGSLDRDQKMVVRQAIRDQFMRPIWEDAKAVLDFLGSTDYHSHSIE